MHVSPISHLQLHQKKEKKIRPKVHPLLYHTFYNCCNSGKMSSMFWGGKLFYQNCREFFFSHAFHFYFHYFIRSVVFEIAPCDSMSLITVLATIKIILESDSIFLLCWISLKVTVNNWTSQSLSSAHKERNKEKEHRLKYLKNQYQLYAAITTTARPNLDKQRIWPKFTLTKVHPYHTISFHTVFNPFTPSNDQDRISPNNINTISKTSDENIEKYQLVNYHWLNTKFSKLRISNVWQTVRRITKEIMGV